MIFSGRIAATLDPQVASQYCYQLFYVKNAEKYNSGYVVAGRPRRSRNESPAPRRRPFARGALLKGTLIGVTPPIPQTPPPDEKKPPPRVYVVEIDGRRRSFTPGDDPNGCKQILLDFDQVGFQAVDAHTYRVTLENPTPYFLGLTGMFPLYPVNPRCVETYGSPNWTKPEHIVTNGPFRLASRKIRELTRLVKSENYWDRAHVQLDAVNVLIVQSDTTALNLYLTGKVDWIQTVPPTIVTQLLEKYPRDFQPKLAFILRFYRINTKVKPLDNLLVRRAINLAINKQEIVDGVTRAGEEPARSLVPPIIRKYMPAYEPALCGAYDPAEARRLLAKAGFPDGKGFPKIALLYSTDDTHQMVAELVQRQLKENLGIDFEPQNQEWNACLSAQRMMNYSICDAGWVGDYVDPNTFLGMFITDSEDNETGWGNSDYDKLILRQAPREPDPIKRLGMLHDAEAILMRRLADHSALYRQAEKHGPPLRPRLLCQCARRSSAEVAFRRCGRATAFLSGRRDRR